MRAPGAGLDPGGDPTRWTTLVARIVAQASPILERRQRQATLAATLAGWRRPVFACSAGLAAAAALVVALVPVGDSRAAQTLEETVMPATVAQWVAGDSSPAVEELIAGLGEEIR